MTYANPHDAVRAPDRPLHPMLAPLPVILFLATLVCDLVHAVSGVASWAQTAGGLLGAGLLTAALAVAAGIADLRSGRTLRVSWRVVAGVSLVLSLEGASYYLRQTGGAETAGVAISAAVALLLAFGWMRRAAR